MSGTVEQAPAPSKALGVVGTRPIRHDGYDKVTGRARYGADLLLADLLHGKVLRSPHAHARILAVDCRRALALPGVKAVVTGEDMPIKKTQQLNFTPGLDNHRMQAENILASGKVLYKGHAVAAVAAESVHIAEEALELINVSYEVLPAVLSAQEAMSEDAPLLHEGLKTQSLDRRLGKGADTGIASNVASHLQIKRGDVGEGFRRAAVIAEGEFTTQTVHQGYIEPHVATALWDSGDRVTVWMSTQAPFGVRQMVAMIAGKRESAVKVVPLEIGGGFGGKTTTYLAPVAALLSRKTGRPVKLAMTRKEVFEGSGPTSAATARVKLGADKDGRITAAQLHLVYEAGAFPGSPVGSGASTGTAPYVVDNFLVDAHDVVCNKQKVAAYRAPGAPQAALAVESAIDELAAKLGMDPLDFRLRNAVQEGNRDPNGLPFSNIGCIEVLKAMRDHPHYQAPLGGANRGRGVALGYWWNGGLASSATINVNADGRVSLVTGSVDIGGTRASVAMQAAEVLGLAAEDVIPSVGDTDSVGWTALTGGSRTAFATGQAAIAAAADIIRQLIERAAILWETQPADVIFEGGRFISRKSPEDRITFKELAGRLLQTGGPVTASTSEVPRRIGPTFAGNIVDVEVDPETGKATVLRFTVVQDVGKAGHPSYVEGQLQGGAVQGIGWALNEGYSYTETGAVANASFLDYRLPTSLDTPMIDTVLVEVPDPGHPFGLRGVGEASIIPPLAAIANAVSHAVGVRMTRLPLTPAVLLAALRGKKRSP